MGNGFRTIIVTYNYIFGLPLPIIASSVVKNSKRAVSAIIPTTKIQTPKEEVCKSHEKYEIRILYFSCIYGCDISYKHLKQIL